MTTKLQKIYYRHRSRFTLRKLTRSIALLTMLFVAGLMSLQPLIPMAAAAPMSQEERRATVGWTNWVPNLCISSDDDTQTTPPPTPADIGSNLFILGDSIMQGAYYSGGGLDKKFEDNDIKATVDAQVSRSIDRPGQTTNPVNKKKSSGLEAVELDEAAIKKASAIVIELGTNTDGPPAVYKNKLGELINKVRTKNKDAPLYIVNIFSPVITDRAARNEVITQVAEQQGASVIDTVYKRDKDGSVVKDKNGKPEELNIKTTDNIHPSIQGYKDYNEAILTGLQTSNGELDPNTVESDAAADARLSDQPVCCAPGGQLVETGNGIPDEDLPGKDNREKIWNYLISLGFKPVEAAGIVGNIGAEGVYDPQSIENGNEKTDPDTGEKVGRTKNYEVFKQLTTPGQDGYGLIGFTPGVSLMGMSSSNVDWGGIAKVKVTKDNFYLISTQLDVVYGYMKNSGDMLKEFQNRSTSPEQSALAFMDLVENPGVLALDKRGDEARKAMEDFAGNPAADIPAAGSTTGSDGLCCPPGGSATPGAVAEGEDPKTTIWNYLVGEMKLSAVQAAGIMGNIEQESGFSPTAENPDSHAYGIIQWLGGRLTGLENLAQKQKKDKSDITVQLEFMKSELNGSYKESVLEPIQKSNNLSQVTRIWLEHYEIPCTPGSSACDEEMGTRVPNAKKVLQEFGDGVVVTGKSCSNELTAGVNGWNLEGPNAMVYYSQCDPRWSKKAYGSSTICVGGCGITSMAMVVATLSTKGKKETPATLAQQYGAQYHVDGVGTSWGLWPAAAKDYGLKEEDLGTDLNKAAETVKKGGLVIISVDPGAFTSGGHIMVIRAVTEDGKFLLADPNEGNTAGGGDTNKTPYSADFLRTQGSLKGLWGFTR